MPNIAARAITTNQDGDRVVKTNFSARAITTNQQAESLFIGGALAPVRMRGKTAGGSYLFWDSWSGTADSTGRFYPYAGTVAFAALVEVVAL